MTVEAEIIHSQGGDHISEIVSAKPSMDNERAGPILGGRLFKEKFGELQFSCKNNGAFFRDGIRSLPSAENYLVL